MKTSLKTSLITAVIAIIALALMSCSFQTAEGASGSVDAASVLKAIQILSEK
jgi:hypothetical protein